MHTHAIDFNPRSPCGERLESAGFSSDEIIFQPTLPVRGATGDNVAAPYSYNISTHAPRAGSDQQRNKRRLDANNFNPRSPCGERPGLTCWTSKALHFNPRSPCGERPIIPYMALKSFLFQPTLPVRGATYIYDCRRPRIMISTHAPRAGSDIITQYIITTEQKFQPTLPVRGATPGMEVYDAGN